VRNKPDIRFVETVAPDQRRGGKGELTGGLTDANQTRAALLHEVPVRSRDATLLEPGARGAEGGMTGEGQLVDRGEDTDAVVRRRICRRQQERCFTEVGPACERRHLRCLNPSAPCTTATGLPNANSLGNTSTWLNGSTGPSLHHVVGPMVQ